MPYDMYMITVYIYLSYINSTDSWDNIYVEILVKIFFSVYTVDFNFNMMVKYEIAILRWK